MFQQFESYDLANLSLAVFLVLVLWNYTQKNS